MKKQKTLFVFILTLMSGICHSIMAQAQQKFNYGVKAGYNLSSTTFTPYIYEEKNLKHGFQIGVTGEYNLIAGLFVQSELMFTTKGIEYKGADLWIGGTNPPITYWKNTINQQYVQVPLKLGYKVDFNDNIRLFANAGYYAAYGIGGKDKIKNHHVGVDRPDETLSRDAFGDSFTKRFDHGISTGFGAEYKVWVLGVNYEWGLNDIRYEYMGSHETYTYKNRNVSLTLGYRL